MNKKERNEDIRRMREKMTALSETEIAKLEQRYAAGAQNFWASNPEHWVWVPVKKPTIWQRIKQVFVKDSK